MINQYIRDYGRRLYGLCTFLCANSYDAEDLYQETWLKVVKNIDKYDPAKEFEPWLTTICVNTYRNTLRRILKSPVFNTFATPTKQKDNTLGKILIAVLVIPIALILLLLLLAIPLSFNIQMDGYSTVFSYVSVNRMVK